MSHEAERRALEVVERLRGLGYPHHRPPGQLRPMQSVSPGVSGNEGRQLPHPGKALFRVLTARFFMQMNEIRYPSMDES